MGAFIGGNADLIFMKLTIQVKTFLKINKITNALKRWVSIGMLSSTENSVAVFRWNVVWWQSLDYDSYDGCHNYEALLKNI